MERFLSTVLDAKGGPMAGVTVTVKIAGTGSVAPIFSDNGITSKANPFTNDANGSLEFYAKNGRYHIEFAKTGATFVAGDSQDILLFDPVVLVQASDSGTPASTAETVLKSYTILADTLLSVGDAIRFRATFRLAANANNKQMRVRLGGLTGTVVIDSTVQAFNNNRADVAGIIYKTGSNAQRSIVIAILSVQGQSWASAAGGAVSNVTSALTDSAAIVLAVTGQNAVASANDIICDTLLVEHLAVS